MADGKSLDVAPADRRHFGSGGMYDQGVQSLLVVETMIGQSSLLSHEHRLQVPERDEHVLVTLENFQNFALTPEISSEATEAKLRSTLLELRPLTMLQFIDLLQMITLNIADLALAHALIQLCGSEAVRLLNAGQQQMLDTSKHTSDVTTLVQDVVLMSLDYVHRVAEIESRNLKIGHLSRTSQPTNFKTNSHQTARCEHLALTQSLDRNARQMLNHILAELSSLDDSSRYQACSSPCHVDIRALGIPFRRLYLAVQAKFEALKIQIIHEQPIGDFLSHFRIRPLLENVVVRDLSLSRRTPVSNPSLQKPLDDSHYAAIEMAMKAPVTLIWGPPGTGKTRLLLEILCRLMLGIENVTILVTAPRPHSVNDLLERFIAQNLPEILAVAPVRAVSDDWTASPELSRFSVNILMEDDFNVQHRVAESRLVFCTSMEAGVGLLKRRDFDVVLIDEAAWQGELETLVPLIKASHRIVLAGDHKQFTGTIKKCDKTRDQCMPSLFEKQLGSHGVWSDEPLMVMLQFQYSMHPDLCSFASTEFYQDKLRSARSTDDPKSSTFHIPLLRAHKRFFCMQCPDETVENQSYNLNDHLASACKKVCSFFTCDKDCGLCNADDSKLSQIQNPQQISTVIFTPYDEHVDDLQGRIPEHEVSAVESYQGSTVDLVVFVVASYDMIADRDILHDMRTLNVAITFAKEAFVVVGDCVRIMAETETTVDQGQSTWRRLLQRSIDLSTEIRVSGA